MSMEKVMLLKIIRYTAVGLRNIKHDMAIMFTKTIGGITFRFPWCLNWANILKRTEHALIERTFPSLIYFLFTKLTATMVSATL